jgi:hypothetical protein
VAVHRIDFADTHAIKKDGSAKQKRSGKSGNLAPVEPCLAGVKTVQVDTTFPRYDTIPSQGVG